MLCRALFYMHTGIAYSVCVAVHTCTCAHVHVRVQLHVLCMYT